LDEFPGDWRIYKSNTNYLTISVDRFVPEPCTALLLGAGLLGMAAYKGLAGKVLGRK